jgi:hypothetical protein
MARHIKLHGIIKSTVANYVDPDELIIRNEYNSQRPLTRRNIKKISSPNYSNKLSLCQRIGKRHSSTHKFGKCRIKKLRNGSFCHRHSHGIQNSIRYFSGHEMQNSKVFISQSAIVMEEGERGLFLQASAVKGDSYSLGR